MSKPERRTRENGCELEPYTNWPLIFGAVAFVLVGVGTVGTMAGVTAITAAPKAVYRWATRPPEPVARAARPPRTLAVVVPEPVVEEPEIPARSVVIEHIEILGKPNIETAASLALEKRTRDRLAAKTGKRPSSRLNHIVLNEEQLLQQLLEKSKEIDIGNQPDLLETLVSGAKDHVATARRDARKLTAGEAGYKSITALVQKRTDLYGLPLVAMKDCTLSAEEAKALSIVSREKIRSRGNPRSSDIRERHGSTATLEGGPLGVLRRGVGISRGRISDLGKSSALLVEIKEDIVRPLLQVYQVQPEKSRLALTQVFATGKSNRSARALVGLAVFDLSEKVRTEAVKQFVTQDEEAVRAELLAAFRHPWAPAAVHAAKAVEQLGDRKLIPSLEKLLDLPDPRKPFQEKGTWYVRELVRVNHLKNCLLCHPPANENRVTLSGPVPSRDREIPVEYYGSREEGIQLVDASTVYLRQDFSVLHNVKDAKPWPELQRFDYLVRTRQLRGEEIPKKAQKPESAVASYPQRDAVRALLEVLD